MELNEINDDYDSKTDLWEAIKITTSGIIFAEVSSYKINRLFIIENGLYINLYFDILEMLVL